MKVQIRSPRDFFAGAIFLLFGLCAVLIGRGYPIGTARNMGAGYFPVVLGALLVLFGSVIGIRSLTVAGDKLETISLRPLLLVLLAIGVFAVSVDSMGIVVATILMTVIGAAASPESRWSEVAALTLVLLGLSVGAFTYGLGLPFKLLPF